MPRAVVLPQFLINQWLRLALAVFWLGAFEAYLRWPLVGGIVVIVVLILLPLMLKLLRHLWPHSWSTIVGVELVMVTSVAAGSFLTSAITRQLMAIASAGLLYALLQSRTSAPASNLQGRLTLFTMTASYWFGLVSLLSLSIFLSWPTWLLAGLSAIMTAAVAAVVWFDEGVPVWKIRRGLWMPVWIGLELWLAVWVLPTSILVGSVLATTAMMLWLQLCRHLWLQTWRPDRGRRYLVVGGAVVTVILLTARWV